MIKLSNSGIILMISLLPLPFVILQFGEEFYTNGNALTTPLSLV